MLLRRLVEVYQPELIYFLHHDLEMPVVSYLQNQGFRFAIVDGDPEFMIGHYAQVDFVVCQMLHSCIFSANAGTAFLNIAYDNKSMAFTSLLEIPDCSIPYYKFDADTTARFDILYQRRAELSATIAKRRSELCFQSQQFLTELVAATLSRAALASARLTEENQAG
jgi:polysaccharide pyruvyl transferase WcaK-like protein